MFQRRQRAFSLVEMLIALAIISVLIGLILAAVQRSRAAAARASCANNLRQCGLALISYHDQTHAFPFGMERDGTREDPYFGRSWHSFILSQLEQANLAAELEQPEYLALLTPRNPGLTTYLSVFMCPSDPSVGMTPVSRSSFTVAPTSYLGSEGINLFRDDGILFASSHIRISDITDGTSQTLLVGERPAYPDVMWGIWYTGIWGQGMTGSGAVVLGVRERYYAPTGPVLYGGYSGPAHFVPGDLTNGYHAYHFWSLHGAGANFLFADGSVHFLPYSADPILPALATRAGQEPTPTDW